eukprot:IDg20756t1
MLWRGEDPAITVNSTAGAMGASWKIVEHCYSSAIMHYFERHVCAWSLESFPGGLIDQCKQSSPSRPDTAQIDTCYLLSSKPEIFVYCGGNGQL